MFRSFSSTGYMILWNWSIT